MPFEKADARGAARHNKALLLMYLNKDASALNHPITWCPQGCTGPTQAGFAGRTPKATPELTGDSTRTSASFAHMPFSMTRHPCTFSWGFPRELQPHTSQCLASRQSLLSAYPQHTPCSRPMQPFKPHAIAGTRDVAAKHTTASGLGACTAKHSLRSAGHET
jgi:hypothetical protein